MMTRTPDEIKKGLAYLATRDVEKKCKLWQEGIAYAWQEDAAADALALIQQLERDKNWAGETSDMLREENKRLEAQNAELSGKVRLLQDAVDQWEYVAASPGAVEDMARENGKLIERVKHLEQDCRNMIEIWEGMTKYVRQLETEREEMAKWLKILGGCTHCQHESDCKNRVPDCYACDNKDCPCHACEFQSHWEWRGVQKEDLAP